LRFVAFRCDDREVVRREFFFDAERSTVQVSGGGESAARAAARIEDVVVRHRRCFDELFEQPNRLFRTIAANCSTDSLLVKNINRGLE
jgi:hypothetical protein